MKYQYTFSSDKCELAYKGNAEIQALQVLKAVCAFLVIVRHSIGDVLKIDLDALTLIAVPIFAMITGYFLISSDGELTMERIKHTVVKIAKLYVIAQLVYVCFWLKVTPDWRLDVTTTLTAIFYGKTFFFGLWYLAAMLEALAILALLLKTKKMNWLPILAIMGYVMVIVARCVRDYIYFPMEYGMVYRNFFTPILVSLYCGMFVRINERKLTFSQTKLGVIALILIVSPFIDYMIKGAIIEETLVSIICGIPLASVVFLMAIKARSIPHTGYLATVGRDHSMNIYVWQYVAMYIIWYLKICTFPNMSFIVAATASLGLSYMINWVKKIVRRSA